MATIPSPIDVTGPDSRRDWINAYQQALWAACQNIDNTAIFLHAGMVQALANEGLDSAGRSIGPISLGAGSASKAASTVTSKMKRASEHINAAIILLKGADAAAEKNVDAPIEAARTARAHSRSSYNV
jgi:hypothetical protein